MPLPFLSGRRPRPVVATTLSLVGLAALGACADPVAPVRAAAPAAGVRAAKTGDLSARLVSNRVRYRDNGARPTQAQGGLSWVTVQTLIGRDGKAVVRLAATKVDQNWMPVDPPGRLTKVQLKTFSPAGKLLASTNYNQAGEPEATYVLPGVARGAPIEVLAQVKGAKGATDVVQASDVARLAPDLRVAFDAPRVAAAGVPVFLTASLTEANGDVGATTTCQLRVDGAVVDRSPGVWVDARYGVQCAFTYRPAALGTHTLRVEAADVAPADFDPSDNAVERSVRVVDPSELPVTEGGMLYDASAFQRLGTETAQSELRYRYDDGRAVDTLRTTVFSSDDRQDVQMFALVQSGAFRGTAGVEFTAAAGGAVLDQGAVVPAGGEALAPGWQGCVYEPLSSGDLSVCSSVSGGATADGRYPGFTNVMYRRSAYKIVYLSTVTAQNYLNGVAQAPEPSYVVRGDGGAGVAPFAAGATDVTIDVALTLGGQFRHTAHAVVPLAASRDAGSQALNCRTPVYASWLAVTVQSCGARTWAYDVLKGGVANY